MRYPRRIRFVAAIVALFSLLFMQLAVAAYVCPKQTASPHRVHVADRAASTAASGADCCLQMDKDNPSLCHAHDHASKPQPLEQAAVAAIAAFVPTGWVLTLADGREPLAGGLDADAASLIANSSAPPIAIRHCCFRL
jgi:hypothetical protein